MIKINNYYHMSTRKARMRKWLKLSTVKIKCLVVEKIFYIIACFPVLLKPHLKYMFWLISVSHQIFITGYCRIIGGNFCENRLLECAVGLSIYSTSWNMFDTLIHYLRIFFSNAEDFNITIRNNLSSNFHLYNEPKYGINQMLK